MTVYTRIYKKELIRLLSSHHLTILYQLRCLTTVNYVPWFLCGGFLRSIEIRSIPSFGWEVKPEVPCRKILWYVKRTLGVISDNDRQNSHLFVHSSYLLQMYLLPEGSGGRVRSYPQPASSTSPWLSMLTCHPWVEQ
jgi:hypothetical protein